jgi:hypothetical protein
VHYYLEIYVEPADEADFSAESDTPFSQPAVGAQIDPVWRADWKPKRYFSGDRIEVIRVEHGYRADADMLAVFCNPLPADED